MLHWLPIISNSIPYIGQPEMGIVPPASQLGTVPIIILPNPPPLIHATSTQVPPMQVLSTSTLHNATPDPPTNMPTGLFMGDAMLPIPDSLISKIQRLEFVDMADLRLEAWMFEDEPHEKSLVGFFKRQKQPVTDILSWVQCFASYVAVLSQTQPQSTPHLMAYMATIIRCHKKFEGLGWVVYDSAYRRRAARQRDLNWAVIDSSLFNTLFTGRAKTSLKCSHCLSEDHTVDECPAANGPFVQLTRDLGISATTSPSYSAKHTIQPPSMIPPAKRIATPIQPKACGLFNSNMGPRCTYGERCRYMHVCSLCFKNHPKASCQRISAGNWKPTAQTRK